MCSATAVYYIACKITYDIMKINDITANRELYNMALRGTSATPFNGCGKVEILIVRAPMATNYGRALCLQVRCGAGRAQCSFLGVVIGPRGRSRDCNGAPPPRVPSVSSSPVHIGMHMRDWPQMQHRRRSRLLPNYAAGHCMAMGFW